MNEFRRYRVVRPEWVVDSIAASRLLPWHDYSIINGGATQKALPFSRQSYQDAAAQATDTIAAIKIPEEKVACEKPQEQRESLAEGVSEDLQKKHQEDQSEFSEPEAPKHQKGETPEEYNARLLSNPRLHAASANNPGFITQFFHQSRLHHLATWKADLKGQMQSLARSHLLTHHPPKRVPGARRYIIHADFDSFFAAVAMQKNPSLKEKPIAIAHGPGPGAEIASCNYPARRFGVKNGMWMKGAQQVCPDLTVLPYDFPGYEKVSRQFYEAILSLGGVVQSVSIDEALIDISTLCHSAAGSSGIATGEGAIYREQSAADEIGQRLRTELLARTGCNISVGIGGSILLARLALRKAKPAGQFQLKPEAVLDFIGDLVVTDLPGVAHGLAGKLEELGVKYVRDLRPLSRDRLAAVVGTRTGEKLYNHARGIDTAEVGVEPMRKSVSAEINWGIRFVNNAQAEEFVGNLCAELHNRLVDNGVRGHQLTMRVMRRAADAPFEPPKHLGHGLCDTFSKSAALYTPTNATDVLTREAVAILRSLAISPCDLRGIGVQMTKLEPLKYPAVAGEPEQSSQRKLPFTPTKQRTVRDIPADPDELDSPCKGDPLPRSPLPISQLRPSADPAVNRPIDLTGSQFILPREQSPTPTPSPSSRRHRRSLHDSRNGNICASFKAGASHRTTTNPPQSAPLSLPPQSQLDESTLSELPEAIRNEVLGYYAPKPRASHQPLPPPQPTTPTKRRRRKPTGGTAGAREGNPNTLSAFMRRTADHPPAPGPSLVSEASARGDNSGEERSNNQDGPEVPEDISTSFLEALPDDIRSEVLTEHAQARAHEQARKRGRKERQIAAAAEAAASRTRRAPPRTLRLPECPPPPTFTAARLSRVPDVRRAVSEWVRTFGSVGVAGCAAKGKEGRGDGVGTGPVPDASLGNQDSGGQDVAGSANADRNQGRASNNIDVDTGAGIRPFTDDVMALAEYLRAVVVREHDVAKAVGVVRWLRWLLEDAGLVGGGDGEKKKEDTGKQLVGSGDNPDETVSWRRALAMVQDAVDGGARERGLPPVEFG